MTENFLMSIWIHSIFSIIGFIIATIVIFNRKGTPTHKKLGWIFWVSMFISCSSSFLIVNPSYSPIHILSALVLFWLLRAIYAARFKPKNWLYIHASSMSSAYISTIIAGMGVIVRKIILPGNAKAGYITSGIVAIFCIYFLIKFTYRYNRKP